KADAHFVEDDPREDEESGEDVEEEFRAAQHAEHFGAPFVVGFEHGLQGCHHVDEEVTKEHRGGNQQQGCPPRYR
ncbi:hypothetical protein EG867_16920, partial [Enterococcus faecalis]